MISKYNNFIIENTESIERDDLKDDLIEIPIVNDNNDYDKINISKKLEDTLKSFTNNLMSSDISIGDNLILLNTNKNKLNQESYDFLINNEIFNVKNINSNNKIDIGFYKLFLKKSTGEKLKKIFYYNKNRFFNLKRLDKVSQFFFLLKKIKKEHLINNNVDFLDVDNKGNLSYLSRRFYKNGEDPYKSNLRQSGKLIKIILKIVKKEYFESFLTNKNIEEFNNKWKGIFDDSYTVKILEGDDILDAYNFDKICEAMKTSSCANFNLTDTHKINTFKVYTENVENIKCLVVYHKGIIYGRRMMFVGEQVETIGSIKKGTNNVLLNTPYCDGGNNSKVDQIMIRWSEDNGAYIINRMKSEDIFLIEIKKTCYKNYPPWDSMLVNFKLNQIASKYNNKFDKNWVSTYGARCLT